MRSVIEINGRKVGDGHPVFIFAEIGLNHNGDLAIAKQLIDAAVAAGCDAVKFQKRDPELCVPKDQRDRKRETPWGYITYMEYRYKVEFQKKEYDEIDAYCRAKGIAWTASCWDVNSVAFINGYGVGFHKVPSALITDQEFIKLIAASGKPVIFSTGMSSPEEVERCYGWLTKGGAPVAMLHCTSTYPCAVEELNLNVIKTLRERYPVPVGYSGHEAGLAPTLAAVALGASIIERHITLDRAMWGSDQAASVEPQGWERLVRDIRGIELALGDGVKRVYDSEKPIRDKLRRV